MDKQEKYKKESKLATIEVLKQVAFAFIALAVLYVVQRFVLNDHIGNLIVENPKLYTLIIWIIFIMSSTAVESILYMHENNSSVKEDINEHPIFMVYRGCMLIPLWVLAGWQCALTYVLIFPFFHDGQYYRWREKLVKGTYPKKWFDQSKTSTAFLTKYMTPIVRTVLFMLGIAFYILTFNK